MSYPQFGYAAFTPATQLMVSGGGGSNGSSPCCGGGDVSSRTSTSGGVVDSCSIPATYDSRLLTTYHPRLYEHNFDSAFYPTLGPAYSMKDGADPWRGIAPSASYYYDPSLAAYGYGGLDFNGARRKNVTRDSTSTLKAWLNEHRKNPYPTKGEKIMLAIITKMTLTQVSTWFANARRRLKKENKMTWEPRNKMDADDVKDYDDDDDDADEKDDDHPSKRNEDRTNARCDSEDEGRHCEDNGTARCYNTTTSRPYPLLPPKHSETTDFPPTENSSSPHLPDIQALMRTSGKDSKDVPDSAKPKIWSLADTATSKSPPPSLHDAHSNGAAGMADMLGHCGWFSVNPYQVTGNASTSLGGFSGYPPHPSCGGFTPPQAGHSSGFVPPQTDTPPQTPPNMKVVSSSGYIAGSQGYQTNGHINPVSQVTSKNNPSYPLSANPLANRSFRADTTPEDYSATGHFRAGTLQ